MKKTLKISLRVVAVLLALIFLAFVGGWVYLKQHKKAVISFIESEAKWGLNGGTVHLGDISIGFAHTFPRIAFTIDTLILRDSLWFQHHHDLINATRAYATLDFFKLIIGKISIGRVQIDKPNFYIYTDGTGYTNTSVFKKNNPPKKEAPKNIEYPILEITNGNLSVDKDDKHKFFGYHINTLVCKIQGNLDDANLKIDVRLDCKVQRMTFNPEKGPFLKDKAVNGIFEIHFNKASKVLQFEKIRLDVDQQPFVFSGKFFLGDVPTPFLLSWETNHLPFRKAASFLSDNIRLKLNDYDISETISHLTGSLDNSEPEYKTPLIHLKLSVENRTIVTPVLNLNSASFTATFNNEEIKGKGHEDSNTVMHFMPLEASWDLINFHCDTVVIRNLIHPNIRLHILSGFQLNDMNGLLDENTLAFTRGSGKLDLIYDGSLEKSYDSLRMISGSLKLDSASINYVPRNLLFTNGNGVIRFANKDIFIEHLGLNSGSTDLIMDGKLKSVFYLINQQNNKLLLDWTIHSNRLNLNDFISYLKPLKTKLTPKKKKSSLAATVTQFTSLLEAADFNLNLTAKQLIFRKFYGNNLMAVLKMSNNSIDLNKINLQHSGGSVQMNGHVLNAPNGNPFTFEAQLKNIDVSKIFLAFNNFGLKSPTDKNLGGTLNAEVNLKGGFTEKAQLEQEQLKGFVKFNLQDGNLVNFEPVQKIQETVFKSRNFSDVHFADLHDLLELNGNEITINRMEIRSSVLTMFVEGVYSMKTGPDLSIQVPLSNLKANKDSVLVNKGVSSKTGISARLRAQNGPDGKIKISWDPLNKAGKKMKSKKQKSASR